MIDSASSGHGVGRMLPYCPDCGSSARQARNKALNRAENGSEVVTVDGPFANSEPGVWEFEYVTEHRETVVVEAPNQEYAAETAEAERDHRGEFVQTTHTESRRLDVDPNED